MAHARATRTGLAGVVAGSLALLLAACGGSPQAGVASLGSTATTAARSAPAGAADSGGGGGGASAGNGARRGGQSIVTVMADGNSADMLKFAQCMRSHGVGNFPEPSSHGTITVSASVSQSPKFPAADQTCHTLLPNGGIPTAAQQAQGLARLLEVSVCMRAQLCF
ncbi:MAG TPA: hypothetical protein VMD59_19125 [Acidimicrobiales bacterium]|nr:hypothetical protein [Acidimicrobiales bacterium]